MPVPLARSLQPAWTTHDGRLVRLYCGDVLQVLKQMPSQSIHVAVTSPPYWGLRSYATGDHKHLELGSENIPDCLSWARGTNCAEANWADGCHVCRMVLVFRELRRVLRDDGVLWLNYGDSMNGGQLAGVPWSVAKALQADGWVLRSDLPWVKRNPMPESVTNRPAKALEYIFMLVKKMGYYFDMEAIKKAVAESSIERISQNNGHPTFDGSRKNRARAHAGKGGSDTLNPSQMVNPNGRNFRNADLWYESVDTPYGLTGLDDELVGLDVTSQGWPGAHFACVDDETEALTRTGWRTRKELTDGEEIAAYDPDTDRLTWCRATFHSYDYDGPLVAFDKRDSSQRLTPNHRCLVMSRKGRIKVREAVSLKGAEKFLTTAEFDKSGFDGPSIGTDWAALVGWYVSEGHYRGSKYKWPITISQSESANPEKVAEITALLKRLGVRYRKRVGDKERSSGFSREVTFWLDRSVSSRLYGLCQGKTITEELTTLPPDELRALLDAFISGDGYRRTDGRESIKQKSKSCIDRLQVIALKLGYRAYVRGTSEKGYSLNLTRGRWLRVCGTGGRWVGKEVVYRGKVWCPSVETGFWLARREGMTFVTGNTFPKRLVEPLIKAGSSERGCCAECGAPWRRLTKVDYTIPNTRPGSSDIDRTRYDSKPTGVGYRPDQILSKVSNTIGWEPTCECHGHFEKKKIKPKDTGAFTGGAKGTRGDRNDDGRGYKNRNDSMIEVTETVYVPDVPLAEHPVVPCTVCDPFLGSGTTACVAVALGRRAVGIDLSREYLEQQAIPRIESVVAEYPALAHLVGPRAVRLLG